MRSLFLLMVALLVGACSAQSTPELSQKEAFALLIKRVTLQYPPLARQARIQGDVVVRLTIGEDGVPKDLRVISGHPLLSPMALETLKEWRFRPYEVDEKPTEAETQIVLKFRMALSEEDRLEQARLEWIRAYEQRTGERVYSGADDVVHVDVLKKPVPLCGAKLTPRQCRALQDPTDVWVIVDAAGNVADVMPVGSDPALHAAIDAALRKWEFSPARASQLPVAFALKTQVRFRQK